MAGRWRGAPTLSVKLEKWSIRAAPSQEANGVEPTSSVPFSHSGLLDDRRIAVLAHSSMDACGRCRRPAARRAYVLVLENFVQARGEGAWYGNMLRCSAARRDIGVRGPYIVA